MNMVKNKLAAATAALSMGIGLAVIPAANAGYLTDSQGQVVRNSFGECWEAVGGIDVKLPECGDIVEEPDTDGDGVVDSKDACPGTPAGVSVDAKGCPLDSDGDGVTDDKDKCPNTAAGAKVDENGCEIAGNVVMKTVAGVFDFDSADLRPDMKASLDDVAAKVLASPGEEEVMVVGHTDSAGAEGYNLTLSERRAQAAAEYLISKGVNPASISVSGMGESSPIADNSTGEGRAKNRRVEIETQ